MSRNNDYLRDPYKKRKTHTFFQMSLIAILFVIVFAAFYACQASKKTPFEATGIELVQFEVPKDDAPVVVFETNLGTFKAVIYPDEAPNYCEYFTNLVNDGYYNGTQVFAVQDSVYFMGGSKTSTGVDDDDTNKEEFDQELSKNLWPFGGSLIAYGGQKSTFNKSIMAGSRILFVNSIKFDDETNDQLDSAGGNEEVVSAFKEHGGVPNFSQQYTIFGQVYDGLDIYNKICTYDVKDEESIQPIDEIKFEKVYMSTYGENRFDKFFDSANKDESKNDESILESINDSENSASDSDIDSNADSVGEENSAE